MSERYLFTFLSASPIKTLFIFLFYFSILKPITANYNSDAIRLHSRDDTKTWKSHKNWRNSLSACWNGFSPDRLKRSGPEHDFNHSKRKLWYEVPSHVVDPCYVWLDKDFDPHLHRHISQCWAWQEVLTSRFLYEILGRIAGRILHSISKE